MKIVGIIIVEALIALGALLLLPILHQRPHWPTLQDPNQILAECAVISNMAPAGE